MTEENRHPNNKYYVELNKMPGKKVIVTDQFGAKHSGVLCGFQIQHMNIVLKTDNGHILYRQWAHLERQDE